jgi:hypothetical protein
MEGEAANRPFSFPLAVAYRHELTIFWRRITRPFCRDFVADACPLIDASEMKKHDILFLLAVLWFVGLCGGIAWAFIWL